MSESSLEERGRALENQFFDQENKKHLEALKKKQNEPAKITRDDLRRATNMPNDAVLDKLLELGMTPQTLAALALVPLIEVAWADGEIQENERTAILRGAHGKGLEQGTPGYDLLQDWLTRKPKPELFETWHAYIKALLSQLNEEQNRLMKNQIVGFAKMVAASAGGFLGIGKVSSSEEKVLARIESAFDR